MDDHRSDEDVVKARVEEIVARLNGVDVSFRTTRQFNQEQLDEIAHDVMTIPDSLWEANYKDNLPF